MAGRGHITPLLVLAHALALDSLAGHKFESTEPLSTAWASFYWLPHFLLSGELSRACAWITTTPSVCESESVWFDPWLLGYGHRCSRYSSESSRGPDSVSTQQWLITTQKDASSPSLFIPPSFTLAFFWADMHFQSKWIVFAFLTLSFSCFLIVDL